MEEFNLQEVRDALKQKVMSFKCPMCNEEKPTICDDGFVTHNETKRLGFTNTEDFIASIATICNNCGYISFHEINTLLKPTAQTQPEFFDP